MLLKIVKEPDPGMVGHGERPAVIVHQWGGCRKGWNWGLPPAPAQPAIGGPVPAPLAASGLLLAAAKRRWRWGASRRRSGRPCGRSLG